MSTYKNVVVNGTLLESADLLEQPGNPCDRVAYTPYDAVRNAYLACNSDETFTFSNKREQKAIGSRNVVKAAYYSVHSYIRHGDRYDKTNLRGNVVDISLRLIDKYLPMLRSA